MSSFNNIVLTNDSFILTRKIPDFFEMFNEGNEMTTVLVSCEEKKHATSFLRRYSVNGLKKMVIWDRFL